MKLNLDEEHRDDILNRYQMVLREAAVKVHTDFLSLIERVKFIVRNHSGEETKFDDVMIEENLASYTERADEILIEGLNLLLDVVNKASWIRLSSRAVNLYSDVKQLTEERAEFVNKLLLEMQKAESRALRTFVENASPRLSAPCRNRNG